MNLRPLGDRVLIRPLVSREQTESGLHLVEHKKPEQMGVVVAVGTPVHPRREEVEHAAWYLGEQGPFEEQCELLRDLVRREPCCKVGDTVLFSWAAGQELLLHDTDDRLLLMKEDDLIAVIED
jgi:co-chaperonin GroES (HSP10)